STVSVRIHDSGWPASTRAAFSFSVSRRRWASENPTFLPRDFDSARRRLSTAASSSSPKRSVRRLPKLTGFGRRGFFVAVIADTSRPPRWRSLVSVLREPRVAATQWVSVDRGDECDSMLPTILLRVGTHRQQGRGPV